MTNIPVSVCRDWKDLNELLFDGSWNEMLGRFRPTLAFRGLPDSSYDMKTSLMRLGGYYDRLERNLLRNFRKYAARDVASGDSVWNWLTLAQHHGLPTRILDWTYSPYVAMHFATEDQSLLDRDAVIWCVDYVNVHRWLPETLRGMLDEEDSQVFTVEMLSRVAGTLKEFDQLAPSPFAVFVEPPSLDDRMINQYCLLSLLSSATISLDQWLEGKPEMGRRIVIPADLKWEVRDKLDQANVTERVLFPGLDGLGRWLKRYYGPRSGHVGPGEFSGRCDCGKWD